VESYVASLTLQQSLSPAIPLSRPSTETAKTSVFTFTEACARAAQFDKELSSELADAAQLQIDLQQAHSAIWPRVDTRMYFQLPFGGNYGDIQKFNGGVFFNYDLDKALFSGDATAVARAGIEAKRETIEQTLQQLTHDLFLLLANREALKTEVALRSMIKSQALDALQTANVSARAGQIKPERIYEYEYQYEINTRLYQEAVRRLADMNRTLGDRLFIDEAQNIVVTDFPELLASIDEVAPAKDLNEAFFDALWAKRHDTKLLEAQLFMKEMAIIDQRRKRIPKISGALGAGSNSLSSSYTQAPLVVQLGVSMPLIDFGDIKRDISKATIDRDLVKRDMTLLFVQIYRSVNDASASLSESIEARKAADDYCNQVARQHEANQYLVTAGLADTIDMLASKERSGEAEIELTRAQMNVTNAAAEYAWTSQLDVVSGLDNLVLARLGHNPFASGGKAK
jgi:outer membrane protein TolC